MSMWMSPFGKKKEVVDLLPDEDTTPNLSYFFKQLWRKLNKIISLNLLMVLQIVPVLISLYVYFFGSPTTPMTYYSQFPLAYGMNQASSNAMSAIHLNQYSVQIGLPTYNTYIYWIIGACVLFMFITYGWQKVGSAYVMRNLVRGEAVFIFSDFFYAIKKNLKQGFFLGIIDLTIIAVLIYDFLYFFNSPSSMLTDFMYAIISAIMILYIVVRFYLYLMIVTFNIKIGKAFKNALIFTALGIKRNLMACLGLIVLTAIAVGTILIFLPLGIGVTLILPIIYYLGFCSFVYTYAAYPVIEKYMI